MAVSWLILIVGGADTGRAPIAAALLSRACAQQHLGWTVASAGVVGHDDAPAEPEARAALLTMGLDLSAHRARSLSDELVAEAQTLLAVDSGVARVLQARYPHRAVVTLGGLAGRAREIPDPFRMQIGAWLHYANEIEALLLAGLPKLRALSAGDAEKTVPAAAAPPQSERLDAVERTSRLLGLLADLPAVVDWAAARRQIEADFAPMEAPLAPDDLARPYVALIRVLLARTTVPPSAAHVAALRAAIARLCVPITPAALEAITQELTSC